jgi:hypothetical protein
MPDRAFGRELGALPVICVHRTDKKCQWEGILRDYQVC